MEQDYDDVRAQLENAKEQLRAESDKRRQLQQQMQTMKSVCAQEISDGGGWRGSARPKVLSRNPAHFMQHAREYREVAERFRDSVSAEQHELIVKQGCGVSQSIAASE